ncbi:hypothetical protein BKA93DRAFT_81844 [Sparassis latifolia]
MMKCERAIVHVGCLPSYAGSSLLLLLLAGRSVSEIGRRVPAVQEEVGFPRYRVSEENDVRHSCPVVQSFLVLTLVTNCNVSRGCCHQVLIALT